MKLKDDYSELKEIEAGVPLGLVLYLLYTNDIPKLDNNTVATFVDDTAILTVGNDHNEAAKNL